MWGLCVESLPDDMIVKWRVPMEVVGSTCPVSPFNTRGADWEI